MRQRASPDHAGAEMILPIFIGLLLIASELHGEPWNGIGHALVLPALIVVCIYFDIRIWKVLVVQEQDST